MQHTLSSRDVSAKPLIAGKLRQVRAELRERRSGVSAREIAAALDALADKRGAADRTIDSIVDRLMKELTW